MTGDTAVTRHTTSTRRDDQTLVYAHRTPTQMARIRRPGEAPGTIDRRRSG